MYLYIVVVAAGGAFQVKGAEAQVDGFVYGHLNGPGTVHERLVLSVQVWVWRGQTPHRH